MVVGYNGMKKVLFPQSRRKAAWHQSGATTDNRPTGTELHRQLGYDNDNLLGRKYSDPWTGQTVLLIGQIDRLDHGIVVELKTVKKRRNIKKQIRQAKGQVLCYCYIAGFKKYRIVVYDAIKGSVIKEIEGKFDQDKFDRMMHRALLLMAESGRRTTSSRQLKRHNKKRNESAWVLRMIPAMWDRLGL